VASETQHVQGLTSVIHLHNNRSCRELNVYMNGQRLKHNPYPVYLDVTLDQTVAYREHLSLSAAKLKSRNNLIAKLAGTSWGASASTLHTSALALCYSVAEYCCQCALDTATQISLTPNRSAATHAPALSNVAPPSLCHKAPTDSMLQIVKIYPNWPVYADVFGHPPPQLASR